MTLHDPARDRAIDFVRALSIIGVVVLHSLMVGVTLGPAGPVFFNAGESRSWFVVVSWLLQVMPLFFVIGGFAGVTALHRGRRRGEPDAAFVLARLHRLLVPAIAAVGAAGLLLAALIEAGVDLDLVETAGYRFGQPLWFLGVFLLCQALLPAMARLHERAPVRTLSALAGVALAIDAMRAALGSSGIGFLNLAFVWLTLQQLGFLLADGRIDRVPRRWRVAAALGASGMLAFSFASGFHSPDLVANLNPPTTALLLVGAVHTALFSLLRPRLTIVAGRRGLAALTGFVSARAMTIYLWHMPVLLTLAGCTAAIGLVTATAPPAPSSAEWWITRPFWIAVALAVTALLSLPLARLESVGTRRTLTAPRRTTAAAVAIAVGSVAALLAAGVSPLTASLCTAGWALALHLAGAWRLTAGASSGADRPASTPRPRVSV